MFVIDFVLLVGFVAASRLSMRALGEVLRPRESGLVKVLIYGAGDGGVVASRELQRNGSLGRTLVGFLDDDPRKRHRTIHGVPVLGGADHLDRLLSAGNVGEVIIASRQIGEENLLLVSRACARHNVRVVNAFLRFEELGDAAGDRPRPPRVDAAGLRR